MICFLYSLPCSNAYVKTAFSQLKHLLSVKRNCLREKLLSTELKTCLNFSVSYSEMYKYLLDNQHLLKAIKSDEKYTFKRECVQ